MATSKQTSNSKLLSRERKKERNLEIWQRVSAFKSSSSKQAAASCQPSKHGRKGSKGKPKLDRPHSIHFSGIDTLPLPSVDFSRSRSDPSLAGISAANMKPDEFAFCYAVGYIAGLSLHGSKAKSASHELLTNTTTNPIFGMDDSCYFSDGEEAPLADTDIPCYAAVDKSKRTSKGKSPTLPPRAANRRRGKSDPQPLGQRLLVKVHPPAPASVLKTSSQHNVRAKKVKKAKRSKRPTQLKHVAATPRPLMDDDCDDGEEDVWACSCCWMKPPEQQCKGTRLSLKSPVVIEKANIPRPKEIDSR